jgi:hypothetical protein
MALGPALTSGRSLQQRNSMTWSVLGFAPLIVVVFAIVQDRPQKVHVGRQRQSIQLVPVEQISHAVWNKLLARHVDSAGNVDYAGWLAAADDLRQLDEYVGQLSRADLRSVSNRDAQKAFWINTYNALTIKGILSQYSKASDQKHVPQIGSENNRRDFSIRIADRNYTLGQIEHDILRKLKEPRIHFAIVCGARGCPRLLNEAYSADRFEDQLTRNTKAFFAEPSKFQLDTASQELRLSPIIKWYEDDFGATPAARLKMITPWLPDSNMRNQVQRGELKVKYLEYDENLNDQATESNEAPIPPPE